MMAQIIVDHGVSWYFSTRLAPIALTCSLRISDNPTADNLIPQETTNQDAPDMGPDGPGLSCPGSSVVAEGARLENPTAPETMGSNLVSSFGSQSLTAESEAGDEPIKPDRTR